MSNRRKFLKDISISSAALAIGIKDNQPLFPADEFSKGKGPFLTTGIKIGEVTNNSAIVWARLTRDAKRVTDDAPQPVILYQEADTGDFVKKSDEESRPDRVPHVEYPRGSNIESIAGAVPAASGELRVAWRSSGKEWTYSPWKAVSKANDGCIQMPIQQLQPGTSYEVKVEARANADGRISSSLTGGFRTAPADDLPSDIKFMVITCQEYHHRDYGSKGFKIYDAMLKQDPDFMVHTGDIVYYDQQAKNIDLARWHWQRLYSFPTLLGFHKNVGSYFMKDDHDTWMNDCYPGMQTRFMGDFTFEQGQKVFLEQVPMGDKTYRTIRWGRDLQIWLVEGRDYRSPNTMPDGPDKTIWGKEQVEWFKRTVSESDAHFRILISPTPIVGPDRKQKKDNHSNQVFYHEGEMLRRFIEQQPNMFIVNGDRHWQYTSKDDETGLLEFGCGPVSNEHAGGWNPKDKLPEHLYLNVVGGYLEVSLTHPNGKPQLAFRHRSVEGNLLFEHIV